MDLDTLIRKAKEKDPDALDTIYRTYYPQMVGICMNIIREDRATVDDLVHDAFILAFVSIGNLRDNSKINEWLTSIVRNVSLKHIEQRERVHTLPISSIKEEDAVFVDSASSVRGRRNRNLISLSKPSTPSLTLCSAICLPSSSHLGRRLSNYHTPWLRLRPSRHSPSKLGSALAAPSVLDATAAIGGEGDDGRHPCRVSLGSISLSARNRPDALGRSQERRLVGFGIAIVGFRHRGGR